MFHRFGSDITLLEMMPRILPIEDEEISTELAKSLKKQGIKIATDAKVSSATKENGNVRVIAKVGDQDQEFVAEKLLVAVGRRPYTDGLGLENTRVELDRGYIRTDGYMRTAENGIYAIGDVVQTPWLAHVASAEGILAVETIAGKPTRPINYDLVPSCTYCSPEVASVGLTETAARIRGHRVKVGHFPISVVGKAQIMGSTEGMIKIVSDAEYGEVLGAHIFGLLATELIAEACMAMQMEATVEDVVSAIHAHPTVSEAFKEAADEVDNMGIHF
jgi:dihydrolipoamide dehydrogenase